MSTLKEETIPMGRPIYVYELSDPDFSWLLTTFKESNPGYIAVESSGLPVVLINICTSSSESVTPFPIPQVETSDVEAKSETGK